jgi:hypothetical protein
MPSHTKKTAASTAPPTATPVAASAPPENPLTPAMPPASPPPQAAPATPAPATTSSPVVLSTTPPVLDIPIPPAGSSGVALSMYRGYHVQPAEIAALPDAIREVQGSTSYTSTMGVAAPPQANFLQNLVNASGWISLRMALEDYLTYAKVQEGEAWKVASGQIDQVKVILAVVTTTNSAAATQFPALARLVAARGLTGKLAAAARKRNKAEGVTAKTKKAKQTASTPTTAEASSAPTAAAGPAALPTTGGGQH